MSMTTALAKTTPITIPLFHDQNTPLSIIMELNTLITTANLPLVLDNKVMHAKLTQKLRQQLSHDAMRPILIVDNKQQLTLIIDGISVSPDWQSLQRRVVSAGRKSELLLQACKPCEESQILDATAGFGHDSLILASSGAMITLLEQDPLLTLLLMYEQFKVSQHNHWQKLMTRLAIHCVEAIDFMATTDRLYDIIYLDPMFPEHSYEHEKTKKGAKVGKHMQALHCIAEPPTQTQEENLLKRAINKTATGGRVVVKRPIAAPYLANIKPMQTWQNNVVRFDGYFSRAAEI